MGKPNETTTIKEIELGDLAKTIYRERKRIGIITAVFFICSIIYSLLAPKIYIAKASFFLPGKSDSLVSSIMDSDKIPKFISSKLGSNSKSKLFISFLESRTITDDVIDHFNLKKYYNENTYDRTRIKLKKDLLFKEGKSDVISISIEHKNPKIASDIANYYLSKVDQLNQKIAVTEAGRQKQFLEKRLKTVRHELAQAEDDLSDFQSAYGVLNIKNQASATIEMIASLKQELMQNKIELGVLQSYGSSEDLNVYKLKQAIKETEKQLSQLTGDSKSTTKIKNKNSASSVIIPAKEIPETSKKHIRLLRNVTLLQKIYTLILQQYELARIEEAKDSPTILILDKAIPPETRAKPKRKLIVLISTVIGFFLSIGFFFSKDIFGSLIEDLKRANEEG